LQLSVENLQPSPQHSNPQRRCCQRRHWLRIGRLIRIYEVHYGQWLASLLIYSSYSKL